MADTYLVTGGMGCIGAWALYYLRRAGKSAVNFDQSSDRHRLDWLMSAEEQSEIAFVQGDLRDTESLKAVFAEHGYHACDTSSCLTGAILSRQSGAGRAGKRDRHRQYL